MGTSVLLLLAAVILLAGLPISGWTFEASADGSGTGKYYEDGYYYDIEEPEESGGDSYAIITAYDGLFIDGKLEIPSELGGYAVKIIRYGVFMDCTELTSVTIPDSVTRIDDTAFGYCTGLTSITIPDSVTSIGDGAFEDCTGLTSVIFGRNLTSMETSVFRNCTGLTSITLPDGLTIIDDETFESCTNLKNITIPDSVTSIGGDAFSDTAWYDKHSDGDVYAGKVYYKYKGAAPENLSVTIKEGTKGIADDAFNNCSGLKSITMPNSLKTIGIYAFNWCTNLKSVTIPNNVTSISQGTFRNCSSLTNVTIPNSVTEINDMAFEDCSELKNITIPNSVASIGEDAFAYSGLESINIPGSVITIGKGAFSECPNLTSVNISYGIKKISSWFGGSLKLKQITIPNSVESIEADAFYGCSGLTSVIIPESVTSIEAEAFAGCDGLTSITIPDSVTNIGGDAFRYCSGLTSVIISKSVESIESDTFYECSGLTHVTIPKSVTSIEYSAFGGCTGLTSVTIPNSVTSIDGEAFKGCYRLTSITIPDSVTSIGECAFGYYYDEADEKDYKIDGFVIKGFENTEAERYAKENGFKFVVLDKNHTHSYTEIVTKKATCTVDGVKTFTCDCGESYTEVISATGHKAVTDKAVPATCTKGGKTAGSHCSVCGEVLVAQKTTKALGHKNKTTLTKATTSKDGKIVTACTVCKTVSKTTVISRASSVRLAKTSYTYNGKAQKPKVTVKDSKGKLLTEGKDYTVKYQSGRKNPGKYTVTVTFKGNYSGKKTLTFTIAPKAPTLKAFAAKKSAKLSWNKQTGASGYTVYMATSKNGKYKKIATVKGNRNVKFTKTGLTKGKTYYFKVAAYTTSGGKTINGAYSKVKSVKAK